jgi:hypothetical protein
MPDFSGRDLLGEWRKVMESIAGRADIPHQLLDPMQKQIELVQEVIERERKLQRQVTSQLVGPVDAVFDMLEESHQILRKQAEALEAAGRALEQTASLVKGQAELFERSIGILREPTELAKAAAGLERKSRKRNQKDDG